MLREVILGSISMSEYTIAGHRLRLEIIHTILTYLLYQTVMLYRSDREVHTCRWFKRRLRRTGTSNKS